jgi:hypothetical protein
MISGLIGCRDSAQESDEDLQTLDDELGKTILERFNPPEGFKRAEFPQNSFAHYLRTLPLKPYSSPALHYDGSAKPNRNVYISVIDLPIGEKNLHQCADAVMRLRAEYLFKNKLYADIHFNFVSDGKPHYYTEYVRGDTSYDAFWKYMEYIFNYANTTSLHDEMLKADIHNARPGDVFIEKKIPYGHAVIIIDMAENEAGEKVFLLAQSYMPAQEIQILVNPDDEEMSPWYVLKAGEIRTPEWRFSSEHLRRFR